ncbi:hypothetical protein [Ruegeria denitrificans]|uniref:hypothetical protein n=1 Tax=Ruegeria denitrificans TaxID=1715692 RepID=UPI003C7D232B
MDDRINVPKLGGIAVAAVGTLGACFLRPHAYGPKPGMAGAPMQRRHGADEKGHDDVNKPGLRGRNATPEESAEPAARVRNFDSITRKVGNPSDGVRTVTRSSDPRVMEAVHEMMMTRG